MAWAFRARTSSRLRCDRLLLLLCFCSGSYYVHCISIREEGNSLPEGTATAAQRSRPSQGGRQQKGSCCFGFTSPGLWLGIAWHKRWPCPREVGPKHRLVWLQQLIKCSKPNTAAATAASAASMYTAGAQHSSSRLSIWRPAPQEKLLLCANVAGPGWASPEKRSRPAHGWKGRLRSWQRSARCYQPFCFFFRWYQALADTPH